MDTEGQRSVPGSAQKSRRDSVEPDSVLCAYPGEGEETMLDEQDVLAP